VVCFYCIQLYLTNFGISPNFYQKLSMILEVNFFTLLGLLLVVANVVSSSGSAGGISAAKYSGAGSATMSSTAQSSHHSKSVLKPLVSTLQGRALQLDISTDYRACAAPGHASPPVLHLDMSTPQGPGFAWTAGACAAPGQVYTAKA
jgi:hypothetical protein